MKMSNIILIAIAIIVVVAIGAYVLSSMKEEDSIAKKNQTTLAELRAQIAVVQKQANELNSKVYEHLAEFNRFDASIADEMKAQDKKISELEYHVLKPRAVNVTVMKPIELKTPEALKVLSAVRVRKVAPARKKVTKKKKAVKKPSKKTIRKVKKQLRELSH